MKEIVIYGLVTGMRGPILGLNAPGPALASHEVDLAPQFRADPETFPGTLLSAALYTTIRGAARHGSGRDAGGGAGGQRRADWAKSVVICNASTTSQMMRPGGFSRSPSSATDSRLFHAPCIARISASCA